MSDREIMLQILHALEGVVDFLRFNAKTLPDEAYQPINKHLWVATKALESLPAPIPAPSAPLGGDPERVFTKLTRLEAQEISGGFRVIRIWPGGRRVAQDFLCRGGLRGEIIDAINRGPAAPPQAKAGGQSNG